MEKTRFEVRVRAAGRPPADGDDTAHWTERGLDAVEFLLSPNPGEELRPLARIASGGELSRILLALNSVAAVDAPRTTLVFDEVDAGIGGRVAEVVGRKLRAIARTHQVLCVTHLPQIASLADHHFAVAQAARRRDARSPTCSPLDPRTSGSRKSRACSGGETDHRGHAAARPGDGQAGGTDGT